uniref:Uncharacterized protein n=1 Tax=Eutreptiella gymnastica TaxID=73025 RepID=A0A7S4CIE2_9EUGL
MNASGTVLPAGSPFQPQLSSSGSGFSHGPASVSDPSLFHPQMTGSGSFFSPGSSFQVQTPPPSRATSMPLSSGGFQFQSTVSHLSSVSVPEPSPRVQPQCIESMAAGSGTLPTSTQADLIQQVLDKLPSDTLEALAGSLEIPQTDASVTVAPSDVKAPVSTSSTPLARSTQEVLIQQVLDTLPAQALEALVEGAGINQQQVDVPRYKADPPPKPVAVADPPPKPVAVSKVRVAELGGSVLERHAPAEGMASQANPITSSPKAVRLVEPSAAEPDITTQKPATSNVPAQANLPAQPSALAGAGVSPPSRTIPPAGTSSAPRSAAVQQPVPAFQPQTTVTGAARAIDSIEIDGYMAWHHDHNAVPEDEESDEEDEVPLDLKRCSSAERLKSFHKIEKKKYSTKPEKPQVVEEPEPERPLMKVGSAERLKAFSAMERAKIGLPPETA